jgi:hypothetical protein
MGPRVIPIPSGAARCCGSRLLRLGPGSPWRRRIHSYAGPSAGQIRLVNGRARCAKCAVRIGHFRINAKGAGRVLHARLAGQCHAWPSYQSSTCTSRGPRRWNDGVVHLALSVEAPWRRDPQRSQIDIVVSQRNSLLHLKLRTRRPEGVSQEENLTPIRAPARLKAACTGITT